MSKSKQPKKKKRAEDRSEDALTRPVRTFELSMTALELLHLRDLFSIVLPTEMKDTVSQRLAAVQDRALIEAKLWQKVTSLCRAAEIPLDDAAPDFVVAAAASPAVSVFELARDHAQQTAAVPQDSQDNAVVERTGA